jgi:hypothetical protein
MSNWVYSVDVSNWTRISALDLQLMLTQGTKSRHSEHRIGYYNERSISLAVAVISTIVASMLLIGAIATLAFVTKPVARL